MIQDRCQRAATWESARSSPEPPPRGKFRVVGVDTFDGGDWIVNDFSSKNEATSAANKYGGKMTKMYVYDDKGTCVGEAGRY